MDAKNVHNEYKPVRNTAFSFLSSFLPSPHTPETSLIATDIALSISTGKPFAAKGKFITSIGVPITVTGELIMVKGEPITLTGVPIMVKGEPITASGEPITLSGEPITASGAPIMVKGEPITLTGEPIAATGVPIRSIYSLFKPTGAFICATGNYFTSKSLYNSTFVELFSNEGSIPYIFYRTILFNQKLVRYVKRKDKHTEGY